MGYVWISMFSIRRVPPLQAHLENRDTFNLYLLMVSGITEDD